MWLAIGRAGTVEKCRWKSPESKLGEKDEIKTAAHLQRQKNLRHRAAQKVEPSGNPKRNSLEHAYGIWRRPSLSSAPPLSTVSGPRQPRAWEKPRRRPRSANRERSGRERYEPNGFRPGGANYGVNVGISASLSVAVQAYIWHRRFRSLSA